eukprot:Transcript_12981.p1 GENE.Transcript_12981~~Transcript_12981.p1  ORF type:complete len:545 (+),score=135.74 Transcript_12981:94-1728(+)
MRTLGFCGTAALLVVLMLLPRPHLSITVHHTVAATGVPLPRSSEAPPRAELQPPLTEEPPAPLPVVTLPPPPAAVAGIERGGYTFFSTDYHIAPIADITDIFDSLCQEGLCMRVEEHSLSGACGKTFGGRKPTCAKGLKVITSANAFDLCPQPHALRRSFFHAYRGPSSALQHVDAFVCNHPPALCELYMPFNKSILVIASVNLEFSRENPERWKAWLLSLRRVLPPLLPTSPPPPSPCLKRHGARAPAPQIAKDPRNVVAANNKYDAEYIRYFAGVDALYIPSYCGYAAKAQYAPDNGRSVLIARNHNNPSKLYAGLHTAARGASGGGTGTLAGARPRFERTEDAYPRGFEYTDLAKHPAVVVVPYTKSVMSFFELYRMNIPIFAPSVDLLVSWEQKQHVMAERIYWSGAPRPTTYPNTTLLSPNTRKRKGALQHWLALSDLYVFPNVTYFDSWEHLVQLLRDADLPAISSAMAASNVKQLADLRQLWRGLFLRMFHGQPPGHRLVPSEYAPAMRALYGKGAVPSTEEPSCRRESRPEYGEWG